jgi:hypothetical protein
MKYIIVTLVTAIFLSTSAMAVEVQSPETQSTTVERVKRKMKLAKKKIRRSQPPKKSQNSKK